LTENGLNPMHSVQGLINVEAEAADVLPTKNKEKGIISNVYFVRFQGLVAEFGESKVARFRFRRKVTVSERNSGELVLILTNTAPLNSSGKN